MQLFNREFVKRVYRNRRRQSLSNQCKSASEVITCMTSKKLTSYIAGVTIGAKYQIASAATAAAVGLYAAR